MFNIHIEIIESQYYNSENKNQYNMTESTTTIKNKMILPDLAELDNWLDEAHHTILNFYRERGSLNGNCS